MAKEQMKSAVLEWLQKQGYPLEMQVAEEFRKAAFRVSQSEFYIDPDTNQPREIDVVASDSVGITPTRVVRIRFIVECKLSRERPWVMFTPPDSQRIISGMGIGFMVVNDQGRFVWTHFKAEPTIRNQALFTMNAPPAYGMVQSLKDGNDASYAATMQAAKAAVAMTKATAPEPRGLRRTEEEVAFGFAAIVLDGQLFTASLDPTNGLVKLEEV